MWFDSTGLVVSRRARGTTPSQHPVRHAFEPRGLHHHSLPTSLSLVRAHSQSLPLNYTSHHHICFHFGGSFIQTKRLKLEVQLRPSSCCCWLRSASTSFTAFAFSNPPPPRPYCLGTGETSIVAVGDHLSCQAVIVLWANKRTCVR